MYCTIEYLKTQMSEIDIAQLSDDEGGGVPNDVIVESIITDKSAYIDNSLRNRYTLPLTNEHTVLSEICADLVKVQLHKRRPGSMIPEEMKLITEYAEKRLLWLREGELILNESSPTTDNGFKSFTMQKTMPTRIFDSTLLDQMI